MSELRVGLGFDTHPPDPDRPLRLGSVLFEDEAGLAGHSDADVACHALADALLGAAALGDLGDHFPEADASTAGMGGLDLLRRAVALVREAGYAPDSCDLVIVAERPRISGRREQMRRRLGEAMGVSEGRVSVKATRPEGLGLTGAGVGCFAVAVLRTG